MLCKIRKAPWKGGVAATIAGAFLWLAGPWQTATAVKEGQARQAYSEQRKHVRKLEPHELRVIRGRQMMGGPPPLLGGPAQPWGFSYPDLGGYGQISTGNQFIALPLFAHGGRGLSFSLYYNTQSVPGAFLSGAAAPPIAHGWSHTFNTQLSIGFGDVTVRQGSGTQLLFTQNIDGSYSAPAGIYDTLVLNLDGSYSLTHKNGVTENFTSAGKLTSQVDRNGNTISLSYYSSGYGNGQIDTITDPAGRTVTLTYNSSGLLDTVTDGAGRDYTLAYDTDHYLEQVTFPSPGGMAPQPYYAFTTNGNAMLASFTDRRGATWSISYASGHNQWPETITDPYSHTLSVDYTNQLITREDGSEVEWTVDSAGNRTSMTLEADSYHGAESTTWSWDSAHNMLTEAKGGSTYTWHYTYDSRGNVLTVEDPITYANGSVVKETYTYNGLDLPTSRIDALSNETDYTYDGYGNLTSVTDPLTNVTSYTYDTYGQCIEKEDARGKTWTTTYDAYGNVTEQEDPLSHTVTTDYSGSSGADAILGRPNSVTSATGISTTYTYDGLGRRTRVTHDDASYTESTYDAEGAVLSVTDEEGHTASYTRNDLGWVTAVTDPNSYTTSFTHNFVGGRTSLTNARSKTITFTLDNAGRPVQTDFPDSTSESATYNSRGLLESTTDGRGVTVSYSYDNAGRNTGIDYPSGTDTSWSYQDDDRSDSMTDRTGTYTWTYSARGDVLSLAQPNGTVSYTYLSTGQRASVGRSGLMGSTSYTYDDAGRLTSLTNAFSETTSLTLDDDGRVTQQVQANGTKVLPSYDSQRGWLTGLEHRKSNNTILASYSYIRDNTGALTGESQSGAYSVNYTYDDAYQLTEEARTGTAAYDYTYTYDAVGNRLTKYDGTTTENYTYDDADKLTSAGSKSYGYDDAGNLTSVTVGSNTTTLTWDAASRLTGITYPSSSTNSFTYNDLGQRTSRTDSGGTTNSLFDGSRVLADSRADYTTGGVTGLISERTSGSTNYYHGDQLSSTRGLTNSSETVTASRERDAWGNVIASSGTLAGPFGFVGGQGYQQDPDSGLMLLGARYYDASVGRFISRDPSRYHGGDVNLYRYSANSPVNSTDPSGHFAAAAAAFSVPCLAAGPLGWALLVLVIGVSVVAGVVLAPPGFWDSVGDFLNSMVQHAGDAEPNMLIEARDLDLGVSDSGRSDVLIDVYRGLDAEHPGLEDAYDGVVRPRGGHSDPRKHSEGNTESVFTSWTLHQDVAEIYAAQEGPGGVVLHQRISLSEPGLIQTPNTPYKQEFEVLRKGVITGFDLMER